MNVVTLKRSLLDLTNAILEAYRVDILSHLSHCLKGGKYQLQEGILVHMYQPTSFIVRVTTRNHHELFAGIEILKSKPNSHTHHTQTDLLQFELFSAHALVEAAADDLGNLTPQSARANIFGHHRALPLRLCMRARQRVKLAR